MTNRLPITITPHMVNIIRQANVFEYMMIEIILMTCQSYFIYQQTLAVQNMVRENLKEIITSLIYWVILDKTFRCSSECIQNMFIDIRISEKASAYFTDIQARADPEYVKNVKNNQAIVPDGMNVIASLSRESLYLLQPILQVAGRLFAISSTIDVIHVVYVLGALFSLLVVGVVILMYDYKNRKKNHKKDINYQENKRNILQQYLTYYVNGMMKHVSKQLSINVFKSIKMINVHNSKMTSLYNLLEIFEDLLPLAITYAVIKSDELLEPVVILYVVKNMFGNTWWLFWQTKSVIVSTASWGTMEEFLAGYIELDVDNLHDNPSVQDIMPILNEPKINEVRLYAESGGGKTTWMLNKVISLSKKFKTGYWIYMEQHLSLTKDEMTIYDFMSLRFPNIHELPINYKDVLLSYAEKLGINNVVREETLEKPFKKVSGGEIKRIMFLQFFLPIIMGVSIVKVAFLDEITAGLDIGSFEKVRKVINELKQEKNIKFVTIDHHDYEVDVKLNVKKKEVSKIALNVKNEEEKKKRNSWLSYVFTYVRFDEETDNTIDAEDDKNKEEKDIRVWIPDLGELEPEY